MLPNQPKKFIDATREKAPIVDHVNERLRSREKLRMKPGAPQKKARGWSHQDELVPGAKAMFRIGAGNATQTIEGTIIAADQFTVKLRSVGGIEAVFFKSALISFRIIDSAPQK